MYLSISTQTYNHKPDRGSEVPYITFRETEVTPETLAGYIREGRCYTHIFKHNGKILRMGDKDKDKFLCTYAVILDLDHIPVDMYAALESVELKPTIAHYTPSNQPGDIRFRFIYLFEDKLNIEEYNLLYEHLCNSVEHSVNHEVDRRVCNQYYNGCYNCDIIVNEGNVYTKSQFEEVIGSVNHQLYYTTTSQYSCSLTEINNSENGDDDYQVRYELATVGVMEESGDERYWTLPSNYYTINRHWIEGDDGKRTVGKWQPGSSRKKRLYNTALILKYNDIINGNTPDREWLTYALWKEYNNYYIKHPDIDYKWISTLSRDVVLSSNLPKAQKHPKFKVKPGVENKRSVAKKIDREIRRGYTDEDILAVYDPSLSLRKNAEYMTEIGLKITYVGLSNVLKRNGLSTDTRKPGPITK